MSKKTRDERRGRLGALDVLRLLAALVVVGFHFTARNSPAWDGRVPESLDSVGHWTMYGRMGVPLFFVISGFVLLMSSWGRDLPGFVASRIGRLFPAYWVAVVFSFVLVFYVWPDGLTFLHQGVTPGQGLVNLTMFQEAFARADIDGPYWSLWYEARFYMLIAVLMLIGMTRARILAFCALWPIIGSVANNVHSPFIAAFLMPDYAPFFAGGMLLYVVYRDGHDLWTWLLIGMQLLFGLNFSLDFFPQVLSAEVPWPSSHMTIGLITVACFGLVALVTLTPIARFSARWMTFAGALTYPLYLIHENLGWFVIDKARGHVGAGTSVLVALAVALVAAVALHYGVEKPLSPRLRRATLKSLTSTGRAPSGDAAQVRAERPAPAGPESQHAGTQVAEVPVHNGHPTAGQPEVPAQRMRPLPAVSHTFARDRDREPTTRAMHAQPKHAAPSAVTGQS